MLKKLFMALFVLVFSIFALDYFKLFPSNRQLAFNNLTARQEQEINAFSGIDKTEKTQKFTDRVSNKNKSF